MSINKEILNRELEALNVAPEFFADLLGVKSSTVLKWLEGHNPTPHYAVLVLHLMKDVERLERSNERFKNEMKNWSDYITKR